MSVEVNFHVKQLAHGEANLRETSPGDRFVTVSIGKRAGACEATFFLDADPAILREAVASLDHARGQLGAIVEKLEADGKREAA